MHFSQLGFVPVSKDFLKKIFEKQHKEEIEVFGRELGLIIAKEYVSYFFPNVNYVTLIEYLDLWFEQFHSYRHNLLKFAGNNYNMDMKLEKV